MSLDLASGPVVEQVDRVVRQAITAGASDVHIEPFEREVRVRYRLDGVLHTAGTLRAAQAQAIASRVKVLASLDVAERRRPQDGKLRLDHDGRTVDVRVSVLPTQFGEKVVLRLLDRDAQPLDLSALGFEPGDLARLRGGIGSPNGIVLVTGPTGSGKTTTLYAALREATTEGVNVTTVEDPVEYDLPGVNQTQARPDIGFGFAEALRAILRQDPDIVMVGEVRDGETAQIAVRAALTGHLVLSTLHTNDAASAPARLTDMGVEPYLLDASLRLVVAQRLVRVLCPACSVPDERPETAAWLRAAGCDTGRAGSVRRAVGCDACRGTGYRGREAVSEVLGFGAFSNGHADGDVVGLREERGEGTSQLRKSVLQKVLEGRTSVEEARRVV
ncbi:MAG: GspE/PulE family protein [Bacteroidota bacterium]